MTVCHQRFVSAVGRAFQRAGISAAVSAGRVSLPVPLRKGESLHSAHKGPPCQGSYVRYEIRNLRVLS